MPHQEINIKDMQFSPFTKIGNEWMIIIAGDESRHNGLTASWGGFGYLWERCVSG